MIAQRPTRGFTLEAIEHARRRYEDTDETQDSIALDLGVHRRTLDKLAKQQGWALRKDRAARDLPLPLKLELQTVGETSISTSGGEAAARASVSLADRLEQAVEKELRKVESLRSQFGNPAHRSIEAERTARTLATLTETLFKVRRLRDPGVSTADDSNDLPRDADEFRRDLAQRIDALVRSRADGRIFTGDEPSGAASPCQ